MIVGFCGKMGAGKDTMGEMFQQDFPDAIHYSFATPLKKEAQAIIDEVKNGATAKEIWKNFDAPTLKETEKAYRLTKKIDKITDRAPETRALLQYWGTDVRRNQKKNYWVDLAKEFLEPIKDGDQHIYITDARFFNEIQLLYRLDAFLVLLSASEYIRRERIRKRDGIEPTKAALNHPSELDVEEFLWYNQIIRTDNQTPEETYNIFYRYFDEKQLIQRIIDNFVVEE